MADRRSIHLFDLDDTLIATTARVWVCNARGQAESSLTPAEFTGYKLAEGQTFDFREFSDVGILSRGIVVKYTRDIIEKLVARKTRSRFGILTARGEKSLHAAFLIRLFRNLFGIRLQKGLIFAVSDLRFSQHKDKTATSRGMPFSALSVPERKAWVVLEELIARGYNDISFYDDSRENLAAFRQLAKTFPKVVFKSHFIDPTWEQRLNEFIRGHAPFRTLTGGLASVALLWEHHGQQGLAFDSVMERLAQGETLVLPRWKIGLRLHHGRYQICLGGLPHENSAS